MKETLVSYETAVLAKEKGFKELVSYYYHPDYGIHTHGDPEDMNAKEWRSGYYSAPTQSFLQKWLYKKYGLWCSVTQVGKEDLINDEVLFYGEIQNNSVRLDSTGDVNPDKCWEEILKKALNLL